MDIREIFKSICLRLADELGPQYRVVVVNDSFADVFHIKKTYFLKLFGVHFLNEKVGMLAFNGVSDGKMRWKMNFPSCSSQESDMRINSAMCMVSVNSEGEIKVIDPTI